MIYLEYLKYSWVLIPLACLYYIAKSEGSMAVKHLVWLIPLSGLSGVGLLFLSIGLGFLKISIGG